MGKYEDLTKDVLGVFGSPSWIAENIKTYPGNYIGVSAGDRYIRVHVLAGGGGINRKSVSGQVLIDIFTPAGKGPTASTLIADKLDAYLVGRSKKLTNGAIQFVSASSLVHKGADKANSALYASSYAVSFNYFGV
jgi:hypothetical protein